MLSNFWKCVHLTRIMYGYTYKIILFQDFLETACMQHCVKYVQIRTFSGPYFPAFGLNTKRYFVSLRIQFKCGEIRTRKNSFFGHFSRSASLAVLSYLPKHSAKTTCIYPIYEERIMFKKFSHSCMIKYTLNYDAIVYIPSAILKRLI